MGNPLIRKKSPKPRARNDDKSKGILDDFAIRKHIAAKEADITDIRGTTFRATGSIWADSSIRTNTIQTQSNAVDLSLNTLTTGDFTFNNSVNGNVATIDDSGNASFDGTLSIGGHLINFLDLADTPANYTAAGSKFVKVNAAATGLEFVAAVIPTKGYMTFVPTSGSNTVATQNDKLTWLSTNATLTITGTEGGFEADTFDVEIDLTNANTWSGKQTFDDINVGGELEGSRTLIGAGTSSNVLNTGALRYMFHNGMLMDATFGIPMPRAGSIVGLSTTMDIISYVGTGIMAYAVQKNGTTVFNGTITITGNGIITHEVTQDRGTNTFVAGDMLQLVAALQTGNYASDRTIMEVEVQFDT
jgi:hypothetical protein